MGKYTGKKCRLLTVMWLTAFFFFVEIVVGYVTNSMALVADSFHMLSDIAALVISFLSIKMSPKKWSKNTFGWARAEVLGALVNAVFLVAICFSITIEACKRFIEMEPIHEPKLLVVVGVIGLLINVVGLVLLYEHGGHHGHSHGGGLTRNHSKLAQLADIDEDEDDNGDTPPQSVVAQQTPQQPSAIAPPPTAAAVQSQTKAKSTGGHGHSHGIGGHHGHSHSSTQMNMRGAFLHVLSDALGSVIVIISALTVWLTEWEYKHYLDPALSIVLVVLILHSVWPLLRESALILLQTVPTHIQVDAIQRRLLEKVDGVLAVHEFHVWQLAGDRIIASAHIRCRNLSEYMKIAEKVKEFFHNEGIHSTTIQPEFVEGNDAALNGVLGNGGADLAANGKLYAGTGAANGRLSNSSNPDTCALDCPVTDDKSCVQATCCQTNNKASQQQPESSPSSSPFLLRQRMTRPGSSDVESGALLDTTGRPVSGGEVTVGVVDEGGVVVGKGLEGAAAAVDESGKTVAVGEGLKEGSTTEGSSSLSSASTANSKPNV